MLKINIQKNIHCKGMPMNLEYSVMIWMNILKTPFYNGVINLGIISDAKDEHPEKHP
jgi:hypothetical protein